MTPPHTPAAVRRTRVAATLTLIVSIFLASPASASNEVCSFAHDPGVAVAAEHPAGRDVAVEYAPLRRAIASAPNRVLSPERSDPARGEARAVALAMTATVASVAPNGVLRGFRTVGLVRFVDWSIGEYGFKTGEVFCNV